MHVLLLLLGAAVSSDLFDRVEHGYADNGGVKIHYASLGQGPLVVMIHGFPDFWYTFRDQMETLSSDFQTVAIDLRGYNLSDKPAGVESYAMPLLVADVAAVIRHVYSVRWGPTPSAPLLRDRPFDRQLGKEQAIVVGHDWGGAVAWYVALTQPQMVEKLVILNLPHPNGLVRELQGNPKQYENSAYARAFQEKDPSAPDVFFGGPMTPETLSGWVKDPEARKRYIEAFQKSDFTAMLSYYKANYPRVEPGVEPLPPPPLPKARMPVLMFHGLEDQALLPGALNGTWEWLEKDLTLVTIPGAGHFVQQDAGELVSKTMKWWLSR
jgi:pimeloyl-ACP methyl ester carboxylesterase